MSSLEIAELTGKDHKHVLNTIRKTLDEVGINSAEFSAQYRDASGRSLPCFNLPRRECDLIIAGYSAKYRLAVIDRWQELEQLAEQSVGEYDAIKSDLRGYVRDTAAMIVLGRSLGLTDDEAYLSADQAMIKLTGVSPIDLLTEPEEETPVRVGLVIVKTSPITSGKLLNATEVGKLIGISNREVNASLHKLGFLSGYPGCWSLTEKGKEYGKYVDYNGVSHHQMIKWYEAVIDLVAEQLDKLAA